MDNSRRPPRRRVHKKRRKSAGLAVLTAMLCLLLVVSVSAIALVIVNWNTLFPTLTIAQASAPDEDIPVWAPNGPESIPDQTEQSPEDTSENQESLVNTETPANPETNNTNNNVPTANTVNTIIPGQEVYAVFPFYIAENAQDYVEFHQQNPHFDAETVVWKVNAFLHIPFYEYIQINNDPRPLLVNPSHRLPYGFVPAVLVPVYDGNPDLLATPETAAAFRLIRASAQQDGLDLAVVSAYRTAERQRVLFDRQGRDGVVARPYHSEHQTGRALDLWGPGGLLDGGGGPPSPTGIWVAENAHNYGFIVRYTVENTHITGFIPEPWHITYVGLEISQYMHRNNILSLEEFVARNPGIGLR